MPVPTNIDVYNTTRPHITELVGSMLGVWLNKTTQEKKERVFIINTNLKLIQKRGSQAIELRKNSASLSTQCSFTLQLVKIKLAKIASYEP